MRFLIDTIGGTTVEVSLSDFLCAEMVGDDTDTVCIFDTLFSLSTARSLDSEELTESATVVSPARET